MPVLIRDASREEGGFAGDGIPGRDKFQGLTQDELSVNKRIANVRSRIEQVCK